MLVVLLQGQLPCACTQATWVILCNFFHLFSTQTCREDIGFMCAVLTIFDMTGTHSVLAAAESTARRTDLIGSVSEARVIDNVLHLICAQGRVVRQEARTRYAAEVDGIESEADRFNQYLVGRRHRDEYSCSSEKSYRVTHARMFLAPEKHPS